MEISMELHDATTEIISETHLMQLQSIMVTNYSVKMGFKPDTASQLSPPPAPCTPANISTEVDCETKSLIVSWPESPGADSYIATVLDSYGQTTTCQGTTEGACSVMGIACGQIYHTSVVSSDGYCESPPSPEVDTPSGRAHHPLTENEEETNPAKTT